MQMCPQLKFSKKLESTLKFWLWVKFLTNYIAQSGDLHIRQNLDWSIYLMPGDGLKL